MDGMSMTRSMLAAHVKSSSSQKSIPQTLSIDPHAFAATLEAMGRPDLIKDHPQSEVQACGDLRFLDATEH